HLRVKTGDESSDQHDDADPEDDAEHGQTAAQFVRAERVHCLLEVFAVLLCHCLFCVTRSARPESALLIHLPATLQWDPVLRRAWRGKFRKKGPLPWRRLATESRRSWACA